MRDVIARFGIALRSTIVGVFLRVFLMQTHPDFVACDREARRELHVAARDFRTHLVASTAQIKAFSVESFVSPFLAYPAWRKRAEEKAANTLMIDKFRHAR